jgi:glutathione synthase/RimK-type ligase-like ATP-grasp enzyme
MILILSEKSDLHVYRVLSLIRARGQECHLVQPSEFPGRLQVSAEFDSLGDRQHLTLLDGRVLDLQKTKAVWYRRPEAARLSSELSPHEERFVASECAYTIAGLYALLSDAHWINPLAAKRAADNKLWQLRLARQLGFRIPPSIVTNDPAEARRFYAAHSGRVIYKPLTQSMIEGDQASADPAQRMKLVYATLIEQLPPEELERVSFCPVMLQPYVDKQFELRITVVGDAVFAAEIRSQEHPDARHDWRCASLEIAYRPHTLPGDVEALVRRLMAALHLHYGAIDMIVTPEGEYVFLEINPDGNYNWIEQAANLPISEAIAESLCRGASAPVERSIKQDVAAQSGYAQPQLL